MRYISVCEHMLSLDNAVPLILKYFNSFKWKKRYDTFFIQKKFYCLLNIKTNVHNDNTLTVTSILNLLRNEPRERCPSKIGELSIIKPITLKSLSFFGPFMLRLLHESISFGLVRLQHINSISLSFWLSEEWKSTIFLE